MKYQVALLIVGFVSYVVATQDFECKPDVKYKQNKCNTCQCLKDNYLRCTRMTCQGTEELANCTVGAATFKDDKGNDCWCVKEYGTVCVDP